MEHQQRWSTNNGSVIVGVRFSSFVVASKDSSLRGSRSCEASQAAALGAAMVWRRYEAAAIAVCVVWS
ncbi:hypothetical protein NL676_010833 [Syzygium grande]|nr:hypothetical protein NL676_010833 [Syzygium grande]